MLSQKDVTKTASDQFSTRLQNPMRVTLGPKHRS
jgi:hypothetical protein